MAWLLCHVASYSALLPRDCCAAHAHRPAAVQDVGKKGATVTCDMHHAEAAAAPAAEPECSLRGTCAGPMAALASLFSNQGILPAAVVLTPASSTETTPSRLRENVVSLFLSPDSPPPRA